jgi:hypothetical protein
LWAFAKKVIFTISCLLTETSIPIGWCLIKVFFQKFILTLFIIEATTSMCPFNALLSSLETRMYEKLWNAGRDMPLCLFANYWIAYLLIADLPICLFANCLFAHIHKCVCYCQATRLTSEILVWYEITSLCRLYFKLIWTYIMLLCL